MLDAYHEAGHAVAAWYLRCPLVSVSIEEDAESVGRVCFDIPDAFEHRKDAEAFLHRHLVISLAGAAAEVLLLRGVVDWDHPELSGDRAVAVDLAFRLTGSAVAAGALLGSAMARALNTLRANRSALDQVATALERRGTLSAAEIERLIGRPDHEGHPQ